MAVLRILCQAGDSAVEWDLARAQRGDPESIAAVQEAERIFAEQRRRGAVAFSVRTDGPADRLDEFDPAVERIIVVPRITGGAAGG
jgi:hypothetical protein